AHRNDEARIRRGVHVLRHPHTLAAEKENILRLEAEVEKWSEGFRRQKDEPATSALLKSREVAVADEQGAVDIVHPCAAKRGLGEEKARRLDEVDGHPETGCEPEYRPRILGDIRLEECETQTLWSASSAGRRARPSPSRWRCSPVVAPSTTASRR